MGRRRGRLHQSQLAYHRGTSTGLLLSSSGSSGSSPRGIAAGDVTGDGATAYRIGTTSALPFNPEECSGCGLSGWGWEDDGWGAVNANGVMLRFPKGGWQRLRIQTREDGLSIDQIVFSAQKYKTTRPGTAKNDTTILQRTQW